MSSSSNNVAFSTKNFSKKFNDYKRLQTVWDINNQIRENYGSAFWFKFIFL
jgi:hypothetical protein